MRAMMTRLEQIRRRLEWPQHVMGAYLGVTQSQVSRIETGVHGERGSLRRMIDELENKLNAGEKIDPPSDTPSSPASPTETTGGES